VLRGEGSILQWVGGELYTTTVLRMELKRGSEVCRIGCLNVRGINDDLKKLEIGEICNDKKLDLLGLTETKLKGKGEIEFGDFKGVFSGVSERVRAREGVAIVLSQRWWECMRECVRISSRIIWVKLRFNREEWVFVCAYAPVNGAREEERNVFWENLNDCLGGFGTSVNVCLVGDLNARVGTDMEGGVVGPFGVGDRNLNGDSLIEVCMANRFIIGNTWFIKKLNHKLTWVSGVNGERGLIDYICIRKKIRDRLLDVNVLRGSARGISDHFLVLAKIRVKGGWRKIGCSGRGVEIVRVERLEEREVGEHFKREINIGWEEVRGRVLGGVEEEWGRFKAVLVESARNVCGVRKVGGKCKRKGSEWWCEEVNIVVREKKEAFEKFLSTKSLEDWETYKVKKRIAKREVRRAKERADEKWGNKIVESFRERSKMFWKEVNKVRNKREVLRDGVKGLDGEIRQMESEVRARWVEYFGKLLNVNEVGREVGVLERERGTLMQEVDGGISMEEIGKALRKVKKGKATGLDGISGEMLVEGGVSVVNWLVRLFNLCWVMGKVPQDWQDACIVPLFKGKGDKFECGSYRGISLLSIVGKVYGRILLNKIGINERICEEQGGFREGRGCMDQVFTLRMIEEKKREKGKDVYMCFMDLEKAYDRVDRIKLWEVLREYEIEDKVIEGIRSFYRNSRACVRINRMETSFFEVNNGLRQGCVMSPGLFNLFIDKVVRLMEREGKGVRMRDQHDIWNVNMLLYADDVVLLSESQRDLKVLVDEFVKCCDELGLRVNAGKSKVLWMKNGESIDRVVDGGDESLIKVGRERLEWVNSFKYLGVNFEGGDVCEGDEVGYRIREGEKVLGGLRDIWKRGRLTREVKKKMFEGCCVPVVMYGSEVWRLNARKRKKVEVFEMKGLRAVCGVSRRDRVRNVRIKEQCAWGRGMIERAEQSMLRWFGHVCRMNDGRLAKKVLISEVEGVRGRGRPRGGWVSGVKELLRDRGLGWEEGLRLTEDRNEWKRVVRG